MTLADLPGLAVLFAVGLLSGGLNVIAAGGSFLTLPALLFLGLPAAQANATNRVGVLAQNLSGIWGYHRSGQVPWRWALAASVPALVGGAAGASAAVHISDFAFRQVLAVAMLVATLWTLWRSPSASTTAATTTPTRPAKIGRAHV